MNEQPEKELRIKGSEKILTLIRKFSATERVIFGILAIAMTITAIILLARVNDLFIVPVPAEGGQIDEGMVGTPRLVNPVLAFSDTDRALTSLVYSGLMKNENDGNKNKLVPDLAQSYTVSPDGLTYTFTLKPNLHFQDGSPLSADDVIFTISEIQNTALKSPIGSNWTNISVSKISDSQVQFVLKQPYAPFLSNTTVGIIPKHIWNNVSVNEFIFSQYNASPIGSGPYKVASITKNSSGVPTSYDLVSWNDYNGGVAYISHIIFHFFSDEKSAVNAYSNGIVDSISMISPDSATYIASTSPSAHIIFSNLSHIFGVFFNQNQQPLLADSAIRQALNIGINRNTIVNEVLNGYGTVVDSPIIGGTPADETYSLDPNGSTTLAENILIKDGWVMGPQGFFQKYSKKNGTTTLAFSLSTSDASNLTTTAQILKQEWANMGVSVTVNIYEQGDLNQNVIATRKYDSLLFGESYGKVPDLYAFWDSSQRNSPGLNIAMYVNASADKLLEDARTSASSSNQISDYTAFNKIIENDMPAAFLYSPYFIYVMPSDVKGIENIPITDPSDQWNNVSKWYIKTDSIWKYFENK